MARRRLNTFLLCILLWLNLPLPLNLAAAAPRRDNLPQTAPCYTAALNALNKKGALYSQGGYNSSDPTDPNTGKAYPRTGPNSFDCSGLVWWAYAQAGITIGMTTYTQINNGVSIPCRISDLNGAGTTCWALGDLIFLQYTGGQHVALYAGNGLFMDCYNYSTGCILHNIKTDPFYSAHFWQARRIVSGCAPDYPAGSPSSPSGGEPQGDSAFTYYAPPQWDTLPDIVGYVSFQLPTCENCGGAVILPPKSFKPNFDSWTLGPFTYLASAIEDVIREVLCWLMTIASNLSCWLSSGINQIIFGLNSAFKLLIFMWLAARSFTIGATFFIIGQMLDMSGQISGLTGYITALVNVVLALLLAVLDLLAQVLELLMALSSALVGMFGFIGGMAFDLIAAILLALQGTQTPEQLTSTHPIYQATHGALQAINDSSFGWLLYLLYGMAYIAFISWLARFLSASPAEK